MIVYKNNYGKCWKSVLPVNQMLTLSIYNHAWIILLFFYIKRDSKSILLIKTYMYLILNSILRFHAFLTIPGFFLKNIATTRISKRRAVREKNIKRGKGKKKKGKSKTASIALFHRSLKYCVVRLPSSECKSWHQLLNSFILSLSLVLLVPFPSLSLILNLFSLSYKTFFSLRAIFFSFPALNLEVCLSSFLTHNFLLFSSGLVLQVASWLWLSFLWFDQQVWVYIWWWIWWWASADWWWAWNQN